MGFSNKEGAGGASGKFANFKEGKIVTKIDGQKKVFTTIEGDIVDITLTEEEYPKNSGTMYQKLTVWINHEDGCTQLGFPFTSGYGRSFCKILPNVDADMPVEISGGTKKLDNGNSYGTVFIRQGGRSIKWYFTANNEAGKKLPKVEEVKVGKLIVKNYEKLDNYLEKVIVSFLKKVKKRFPYGAEGFKDQFKNTEAVDITDPIDDLPF